MKLKRQLRRQWRRLTALMQKHTLALGVGAHAAVIGSCAVSIATAQPLTWATVVQAALIGWSVGAILMLFHLERAMKQNRLTQRILADYGRAIDKGMTLELENFAMRQYFKANNIEFTVTRDGDNVSATAEYKGANAGDATDHHEGKDRTVH